MKELSNDELIAQVKSTFRQEFDAVPPLDVSSSVPVRVRQIKRSRRLTTVAVVAVLAAALPISVAAMRDVNSTKGTPPATSPTDNAPQESRYAVDATTITLADLSVGSAPRVPYVEGGAWHDGDRTISLHDGSVAPATVAVGDHVFAVYAVDGPAPYAVDGGRPVLPPKDRTNTGVQSPVRTTRSSGSPAGPVSPPVTTLAPTRCFAR